MYDAWGNVTVQRDNSGCRLSRFNPFLYRSYIYDYETGLYYLQSRYYDPEIGRFLNADDPMLTIVDNGAICNPYAYCDNSPINKIDIMGYKSISISQKYHEDLISVLEQLIPNIYTEDLWEKTLWKIGTKKLYLKVSASIAAQTNKNAIFGAMFSKKTLELSMSAGIGKYGFVGLSTGIGWRKAYLKFGLLIGWPQKGSGLYAGVCIELGVPTWMLIGVAAIAVALSVYAPVIGAYITKIALSIGVGIKTAASTLLPLIPSILRGVLA